MRELVLPTGITPGSPEAVAYIESQVPTIEAESAPDPAPDPPATTAYDLIVAGLEIMLDGFKELRDA